jgi:uncharacterized protein
VAVRPTGDRRFRLLALTIALPLLAFSGFLAVTAIRTPTVSQPSAEEPPIDLRAALERAGIDVSRYARDGETLRVETTEEPESIAARLQQTLPSAQVTRDDRTIRVSRGGMSEVIVVSELPVVDSGAGLVSAGRAPAGKIAILLDDVGFQPGALSRAAAIHPAISFSVFPYAPGAARIAASLRGAGHDVLCHLPMEPTGYPAVDPGGEPILTHLEEEEIRARTLRNLDAVPGVIGVNNHMGSRATSNRRVMRAVVDALLEREGLFFVDSRTSSASLGHELALAAGLPSGARDVFLDDDRSVAAVRRQVRELAGIARKQGLAIGIGHLHASTLSVLEEEIPRLEGEGFTIVPISAAVRETAPAALLVRGVQSQPQKASPAATAR